MLELVVDRMPATIVTDRTKTEAFPLSALSDLVKSATKTLQCFNVSTLLLPDILVALDIDLMKHRILRFSRNVRLHLHGDVAGEDREQQPLLLLVLLLGGQASLDALPGLHEGLPLGHLAGVVGQHTGYVCAEEEHGVAAHLNDKMFVRLCCELIPPA